MLSSEKAAAKIAVNGGGKGLETPIPAAHPAFGGPVLVRDGRGLAIVGVNRGGLLTGDGGIVYTFAPRLRISRPRARTTS
ncbi:MAG TPA: hypothetical protein VM925_27635 [Labilithrix sp.]|nr:hypothetical protein [Labilithrix sp.]